MLFDCDSVIIGAERIFFVDFFVVENTIKMIVFVLENNCRITGEFQCHFFVRDNIIGFQCNLIVTIDVAFDIDRY